MPKGDVNPMQSAHDALRCSAHSKRTGFPCRAPAVRGWSVCRMHGARGGAPHGTAHGRYMHGERSQDALNVRKQVNALVRAAQELLSEI